MSQWQLQVAEVAHIDKGQQADANGSRFELARANVHLRSERREFELALAHVQEHGGGDFGKGSERRLCCSTIGNGKLWSVTVCDLLLDALDHFQQIPAHLAMPQSEG